MGPKYGESAKESVKLGELYRQFSKLAMIHHQVKQSKSYQLLLTALLE